MKSFVVASVILLLIVALVTVNSLLVVRKADELLVHCSCIENGSAADELALAWQHCREFLLFSTHRSDISRADDALIQLLSHDPSSESGKAALEAFISAMQIIRENNRFTFGAIF